LAALALAPQVPVAQLLCLLHGLQGIFDVPNARRVATMTWLRLCLSIPFCTLAVLVTWLLSKAWAKQAKQAKQLCFHSKRC